MRELFDWVYRILRSKMLGAVVIIAMAVLALLGTLIAQAPASADEQAYAAFLESVRPRYGGWTPILDALGLYQLWSSRSSSASPSCSRCRSSRAPCTVSRSCGDEPRSPGCM